MFRSVKTALGFSLECLIMLGKKQDKNKISVFLYYCHTIRLNDSI